MWQQTLTQNENFGFGDKTLYKTVICKVYSTLMCQVLIALIFAAMATLHDATRTYLKTHPELSFIATIITFGIFIVLACCENVRRKSSTYLILLFIFTLAGSFLFAISLSFFYPEQVLSALGLSILICFALTIFAFQTKIDFTVMGGFLIVLLIISIVASSVALFFPGTLMTPIIASVGAIIISLYLIYDTQMMIVGGDRLRIQSL